jgi:hypothetical protein
MDDRLGADFPGEDDLVRLAQYLAGDSTVRVPAEVGVEDAVGDVVAYLVRVAVRDGFRGKGLPVDGRVHAVYP